SGVVIGFLFNVKAGISVAKLGRQLQVRIYWRLQFNYAGRYTTSDGSSAGNGEILLVRGQWVSLFGLRDDNETGSQYSNVAVRLAKPGGS
ncbi:MAG: hypothetical protein ABJ273_11970, partial [Marinobacter alexandrii]